MDKNNVVAFRRGTDKAERQSRFVARKLRAARLAAGLNQTELAAQVGISRQAISAFEQGAKNPDGETIARIAQSLDQPFSFFASEEAPRFGEFSARFFRAFGSETRRRNEMCAVWGDWLVQLAKYYDRFLDYPAVDLPSYEPSAIGERYSEEEIESAAEDCRSKFGLGLGPISNVLSLVESKGVITCRLEMKDEEVGAFSFWNGTRPVIFLASDKKSSVRARFDVAHELGHLVLHRGISQEDLEDPRILKEVEKEANRFAGAFLLPSRSFPAEVMSTRLEYFIELKKRWKVAIQAMVYRCKTLGIFDEEQVVNLYKQISRRRWRTEEPLDDIFPLEQPKLLRRAFELVRDSGILAAEDIFAHLPHNPRHVERLLNLAPGTLEVSREPEPIPVMR
jgi:Zn-dependent peptidase ImmA (M78 family)/transcriptional regulator with XRE-family HTH domain